MQPMIREVITIDPLVRGAIKKYEVVDAASPYDFEPLSSHYTETEAWREACALLDV